MKNIQLFISLLVLITLVAWAEQYQSNVLYFLPKNIAATDTIIGQIQAKIDRINAVNDYTVRYKDVLCSTKGVRVNTYHKNGRVCMTDVFVEKSEGCSFVRIGYYWQGILIAVQEEHCCTTSPDYTNSVHYDECVENEYFIYNDAVVKAYTQKVAYKNEKEVLLDSFEKMIVTEAESAANWEIKIDQMCSYVQGSTECEALLSNLP